MKRKLLLSAALIGILGMGMGSCSHDQNYEPSELKSNLSIEDPFAVSRADIQNVLNGLTANKPSCRKMRAKTQNKQYTIATIIDKLGNPAIYVINYANDGGFVLVSATKKYTPVLAYAQSGSYSIAGVAPEGVRSWQDGIVNAIAAAGSLPSDSTDRYVDQWNGYTQLDTSATAEVNPGIGQEDFDPDKVYQQKEAEFIKAGYIIHHIGDEEITGNQAIDEQLRGEAEYDTYPDYRWQNYAIVLEWTESTDETVGNFMQSKWGQGSSTIPAIYNNDYNQYCPIIDGKCALAGCVPVAIGQIMRYYEYPGNLGDWNDMPYLYATPTTAKLLRAIGDGVNVQYSLEGSGATLSSAVSYLNKYFSTQTYNYSFDVVFNHIKNKEPVYLRADVTDTVGNCSGHAFLCTGGSKRTSVTYYALYTFVGKYTYSKVYGPICMNQQHEGYAYLNWGWSGWYDGMYSSNSFVIPDFLTSVNNIKAVYISIK